MAGNRIPQRVAALDADMEDCFDDGIISVSSAGNGRAYHATPGDQDWFKLWFSRPYMTNQNMPQGFRGRKKK